MKLVLRTLILMSLIVIALAISWYPWREPDVDVGASAPAAPEAAPVRNRPDPRADHSARPPVMSPADQALARAVVALVNAERAKAKCLAVSADPRLAAAAVRHSAGMVRQGHLSHTAPDGSGPWQRARAAGYPNPTGENIAVGYRDARTVMAGWVTSKAHRATIVDCRSRTVGVGIARTTAGTPYWTQLFGA
ncbi:MAG TPA: CAP domain-containing protein [Methylomirabilota bacterium]|nr:CAP domain-containing protein [Methylomirabilota bacterium]